MPKKPSQAVLKVGLSGASGRMGTELRALIAEDKSLALAGEANRAGDWKKVDAAAIDLVIDFSNPEGFQQALRWCLAEKKPLVSGTTGLSSDDQVKMAQAGAKIPLLHSANMSLGIAVLGAMLKAFGPVGDWDFQIDEIHHSQKKDKPSGTALLLQSQLTKVLGRPLPEPHATRGGGVPGIHQIWAMGPEETLLLQHTAFHRRVFARGALKAARWLFDKKQPGLYDLSDLYKMN